MGLWDPPLVVSSPLVLSLPLVNHSTLHVYLAVVYLVKHPLVCPVMVA